MLAYNIRSSEIRNRIYIPKYYDPLLKARIASLSTTHDLITIGELIDCGDLSVQTGHEIGKMAYGTGNIPFVRTSDITNWEIKTVPKQGVSHEIYQMYAAKEDVRPDDILLVRDGTYLIGTNCIVTQIDTPMLFQSHILKIRVNNMNMVNPCLLFLMLNNSIVQRQIRNVQFTADIIDTLGSRYREVILPVPKDLDKKSSLTRDMAESINRRVHNKVAVKQMPLLIERVLDTNSTDAFEEFFSAPINEIISHLVQDTVTLEYGGFCAFKIRKSDISNNIFMPKYYDPGIDNTLDRLKKNCDLVTVQNMIERGIILLSTGDEIGKAAYGTGDIPFVRTSDFSNWEIKANTKQGVSEEIYEQYAAREDVQVGDILLVRDGTYLVGTSCIVTESDRKMLYCGGIIKIRVNDKSYIDEYLLLGLLNSYVVKRQIRSKQFTRDVIDTIGQRLKEVIIPVPKSKILRDKISSVIKSIIDSRINARNSILGLSEKLI